jgi:hypothetical protein
VADVPSGRTHRPYGTWNTKKKKGKRHKFTPRRLRRLAACWKGMAPKVKVRKLFWNTKVELEGRYVLRIHGSVRQWSSPETGYGSACAAIRYVSRGCRHGCPADGLPTQGVLRCMSDSSKTAIVGSNTTRGINRVCMSCEFCCCVV